MGLNMVEKILKEHRVSGELKVGDEIAIRIDQTLTQDATGTLVYLQFESMGLSAVTSELAVSYVDHNTIQIGSENADDHAYLQSAAARYGAVFSRAGNGICHQLHLERFGKPGQTLLGSDSHTPTAGGLGMVGIGAGGIDVAVAMGGGPFYLTMPKVIRVELKGNLKPWVSAKDVVLKVLELLSTKGNVGCALEYGGPGVKNLDVPERATITNMGAECGVTTSVFPSDEVTRRFMEAQGRADGWRELAADSDAEYARVEKINLAELEPLAAAPHSPGNIASISSLAGTKVDQILIGSCTNSSYRDLKMVAKILEGKKIDRRVSLGIAPGSRQVLAMLAGEGALAILIRAGARILENACGFCIGNSLSPGIQAISLRTSNRNFEGRSGTASAKVYLVSPETAAVAALYGRVVDARTVETLKYPRVTEPKAFDIDDSMFIMPDPDAQESVTVIKGPGIGLVPKNTALPDVLAGVATIKVGDKITTDHIMPAGERLKYRSNVEKYSRFVFEGVDPTFSDRAAKNRDAKRHNFIIAGESYGQGSSREHAALCPMFLGVKAVIARSFERIHQANLINFGIVPFVFRNGADYAKINAGDKLRLAGVHATMRGDGRYVLMNETQSVQIPLKAGLSSREIGMLMAGGLLNSVAPAGR
jgi:aconitate hydratase